MNTLQDIKEYYWMPCTSMNALLQWLQECELKTQQEIYLLDCIWRHDSTTASSTSLTIAPSTVAPYTLTPEALEEARLTEIRLYAAMNAVNASWAEESLTQSERNTLTADDIAEAAERDWIQRKQELKERFEEMTRLREYSRQ